MDIARIKCKKAVSHIEMAISFGIFIVFVFFLLFYLKPMRSQNITGVLIDAVINGLERNATLQLIEIPLTLKIDVADCFQLGNPFYTTNPKNMFVKDANKNLLKFALEGDNIRIQEAGSFYYLFFSEEEFLENQLQLIVCTLPNNNEYEFGATKTYQVYSISKLESISQQYYEEYGLLKQQLNFPMNYDFTIKIVIFATKEEIANMEIKKPEQVEIMAREIPIEIIQRDGSILKAVMDIQVW